MLEVLSLVLALYVNFPVSLPYMVKIAVFACITWDQALVEVHCYH